MIYLVNSGIFTETENRRIIYFVNILFIVSENK